MASPGAAASPRRGHSPLLLAAALLLALAVTPTSTTAAGRGAARECTYTLRVKTSCASPAARTSDAVAVAFGDAYRNEAHAARLPTTTPGSRALERCGTDTFRLPGPCGYGVCYLYLRRDGRDGWTPEWAQVVEPGPRSGNAPPATATFYFGDPLPDGVWYGHDRCTSIAAATDAAARTASKSSSAASPRG